MRRTRTPATTASLTRNARQRQEEQLPNQTIRTHRRLARALHGAALSVVTLVAAACADDTGTAPRPDSASLRPAALSAQRAALSGVDCGCSRTGPYKAPDRQSRSKVSAMRR